MLRIPVALTLLAALAASRAIAQQADTLPRLRPQRFAGDTLRWTVPPAAAYLLGPRVDPAAAARRFADAIRAGGDAREAARLRYALAGGDSTALFGLRPEEQAITFSPTAAPEETRGQPTVLQRYADLGMQINARFELRFDHLKNLHCQPADFNVLSSGCTSRILL